ncbi:hypothetical protein, partial [Bacillus marinisedimentorum]|uniref:hypothetical protein n=1 Tax=Bacillus marinisedimentorum TaxID=1821260 RepID=UPI001B7FF197
RRESSRLPRETSGHTREILVIRHENRQMGQTVQASRVNRGGYRINLDPYGVKSAKKLQKRQPVLVQKQKTSSHSLFGKNQ